VADTKVAWRAQEGPQSLLISCPAREIFFGGARGGGKTDAVLGEFAVHAAMYGENASGLMIRRNRTELLETIERSKQIYGKLGATYNESKSFWRFQNGARLRFGYIEREADADQYQGWSLTRLYVEEVGTFPSPKPINKLMATLRSGAGVPVKFICTGNPGGAGQQWVRRRWIEPNPKGNKILKREFKNPFTGEMVEWEWCFIPSKVTDNAYLGSDYIARLQHTGSAELVRAWLQGDWDAVEGAFFSEWDEERHVIPAFSFIPSEADGLFFRALDWGYAAPFSVGWYVHLRQSTTIAGGRVLPAGCLVKFKEWYGLAGAAIGGLRLPAETLAKGILSRDPVDRDLIAYTVADPSTFAENGGPSIAERMSIAGVNCRPADNKRVGAAGYVGGWDQMRGRLQGKDGDPMLVFTDNCEASMRTIPVLQHNPDRPEDLDTEQEDHAADETRYACMSRPWHKNLTEEETKHVFKDYKQKEKTDIYEWLSL
jgi:hypothetical protein